MKVATGFFSGISAGIPIRSSGRDSVSPALNPELRITGTSDDSGMNWLAVNFLARLVDNHDVAISIAN